MKEKTKYPCFCQNCVWLLHPYMITTYCIRNQKCDNCGKISDLAIVKLKSK